MFHFTAHGTSVSPSACFKECLTKTNEIIISAEFTYDFLEWECVMLLSVLYL